MKPLRFHLALWTALLIFCAPFAYIATQEPGFVLSRENFGLILWRGGFRSWQLHWCDGYELGHEKPKPVRMDKEGRIEGYGYRWIPRFSHADVRPILRRMGLSDEHGGPPGSMVVTNCYFTNIIATNLFIDIRPQWVNMVSTNNSILVYSNWFGFGGPTYTRLQHLKMALGLKP